MFLWLGFTQPAVPLALLGSIEERQCREIKNKTLHKIIDILKMAN
ncbi:hypothetical protein SAMN05446037_104930 [Anaerovirgula multivorans]|uniref:Uncharacterized protein n=1 Tax=Anaerovirgula multivorans TaxID=312168 RepID=A0A239KMB2_9FIRM|nr:hypothetical protein [Anaerovirgula multivorans]SNT18862.1 hypothetical protein SAMN05446037_104930 [Anaerovirgula multivorans]